MFKAFGRFVFLFFKASRVKTLSNSFIPVLMSSSLLFKEKAIFHWDIFFCSLLSVLFIQIAVNMFNDAFDGREGLDDKKRLGPKRLVGSKQASFAEMRGLAFFSLFLACLFGFPLVARGGFVIFCMGLLSLLACYFYTGSPYSLLKLGLSEICVVLFFGFFIVFGVYYLQSLDVSPSLFYLALPCGLWSLTFLLINHLRDFEGDKERGRKHFITLYRRSYGFLFVVLIQAFIYLLCFYWLDYESKAGLFSLLSLPLSLVLLYRLGRAEGQDYNQCLSFTGQLYCFFGLSWIYGLLF